MAEREWAKKDCIDDRKNRDICTDPKRQCQDGDKREAGRFTELSNRKFEIVHITRFAMPESDRRVRLAAPEPGMQSMQ